jgi:hypothetical protein
MSTFLRRVGSHRKLRLFACACCREVWPAFSDSLGRRSVEVAERLADGLVDRPELRAAHAEAEGGGLGEVLAWLASHPVALVAAEAAAVESAKLHWALATAGYDVPCFSGDPADHQGWDGPCGAAACREYRRRAADLLRCIFGNPFRPAPVVDAAWLAWNEGTVLRLARDAYEHLLLPSGHLDPARLAVVADALEDAGCADANLLGHLRGPGPHVRGCWAVDLVLGKG